MGSESGDKIITIEFLSEALGPDFEIQDFTVCAGTKPGDNFTSLIYTVEVKGRNKSGSEVTLDLLCKCYPIHASRQEFGNKSNIFFKELEVYRLWLPELRRFQTEVVSLKETIKLPYPPFFHGKAIDFESEKGKEYIEGKEIGPLDNFVILEDVRKRGFRMTNRREPMDIHHIRLVVQELAKIHSLSWAYKSYVGDNVTRKFPCLVNNFFAANQKIMMSHMESSVRESIKILNEIEGADKELSRALNKFQDIMPIIYDVLVGRVPDEVLDPIHRLANDGTFGKDSKDRVPWRVICHGDCWSNNMLFKYDEKSGKPEELIIVDLQMVRETCVMPDLVYAIYASTDSAFRKIHLNELMELYVDTFNGFCRTLNVETLPGFTLESFKYRFHRFKLLGLFMALMVFPGMLKNEEESSARDQSLDKDKSLEEIVNDVGMGSGSNPLYNDRLIGILKELIDEGVI